MTLINFIAFFFLLLSVFLFLLGKSGRLNDSLDLADKIASILSFLLALTLLIIPTVSNNSIGGTANPAKETFIYQIQVQDRQTGSSIEDATVTIAVTNNSPQINQTDSNGYASIEFSTTYLGETAKLAVDAPNFAPYSQFIELNIGLPHIVVLDLKE